MFTLYSVPTSSAGICLGAFFCPITCFHLPRTVAAGVATYSHSQSKYKALQCADTDWCVVEERTVMELYTNMELSPELVLNLQQKGVMEGLNLKQHSLEFPQSSQKLVKPDLPRSLLSHASIPIHPMTQYLWKAEAPVPLHPVRSLHIDPASLILTVYLQYVRWSGGRGRSRKTHLLAGGAGTWADHQPPAQRSSTVAEGSTPALRGEGHDGCHFKSEEGQQAIQLKESRKQCHVSQIPPKSLQL